MARRFGTSTKISYSFYDSAKHLPLISLLFCYYYYFLIANTPSPFNSATKPARKVMGTATKAYHPIACFQDSHKKLADLYKESAWKYCFVGALELIAGALNVRSSYRRAAIFSSMWRVMLSASSCSPRKTVPAFSFRNSAASSSLWVRTRVSIRGLSMRAVSII